MNFWCGCILYQIWNADHKQKGCKEVGKYQNSEKCYAIVPFPYAFRDVKLKSKFMSPVICLGIYSSMTISLWWHHTGHDGVSNHQPHSCLLSSLFGRRSKKTSKFSVTGLSAGNSSGTGEFPAQMASNAENVSTLMTSSCQRLTFEYQRSGLSLASIDQWIRITWYIRFKMIVLPIHIMKQLKI